MRLSILTALVILAIVAPQMVHTTFGQDKRVKVCGNNLYEVMRVLCRPSETLTSRKKRDERMALWNWWSQPVAFVYTEQPIESSFQKRTRGRNGDGIVETCCFRSCTLRTLSSFCSTALSPSVRYNNILTLMELWSRQTEPTTTTRTPGRIFTDNQTYSDIF
ncbi:hypothetical protein CHUAL_012576 [Chamberlinius hualienensis]